MHCWWFLAAILKILCLTGVNVLPGRAQLTLGGSVSVAVGVGVGRIAEAFLKV